MTVRDALRHAITVLQAAQVPDFETDAGLLLAHVTGFPRMELALHGPVPLSAEQERRFLSLLFFRARRRPLQYLIGEQYFYGLPFQVDERVLIPRPDTEALCELALSFLRGLEAPDVLDLCTGSGAIATVVSHHCPTAHVTATDISKAALALAVENAERNRARVRFLHGDLFAPVAGQRFHCVVSNPPYIESAVCPTLQAEVQSEPLLALDGGADGLAFYRRIAKEAAAHLHPGGLLCMEIGDTQKDTVPALLSAEKKYENIAVFPDLSGTPRVVCAYALTSPT